MTTVSARSVTADLRNGTGQLATGRLSAGQSLLFDGFRLLAAQLVLLGHAFDFFDWNSSLHDPTHPQIQRLAVTVFFLLSGFLIPWSTHRRLRATAAPPVGRTVAPRASTPFVEYLIARATRIYAGLLPALVFIALADALPAHRFERDYPPVAGATSPATWFANLLNLQEFPLTALPIFGTGDPLWTLAVEWWIYILFGLLVLRPRGWWILFWPPALISVAWNSLGGTGDGIALVWFLGWAVHAAWRRVRRWASRVSRPWFVTFGAVSALLGTWSAAHWGHRSHFGLDVPFAVAAAIALLAFLLALDSSSVPSSAHHSQTDGSASETAEDWTSARWIRAGADISYTLYLTHFTVLTLLYEWRGRFDPLALVAFAFVLCNVVAWALSWFGERHTGRLRDWIRRRRQPNPTR